MKILTRNKLLIFIASLYFIFCFLRLRHFNFNPTYFICAGKVFCDKKTTPQDLVIETEYGYDGQFYYRLSLNPFTSKLKEYGISIDAPAYRQQRIMYPLLVWMLSLFGRENLVAWVMILVNYFGIIFIIAVLFKLAEFFNFSYLELIAFGLYPGFLLTLSRNLTEIVAVGFGLTSLLYFLKNKKLLFCIFSIMAVLAKETSLFMFICILLVSLFYYKQKVNKIFFLLLPIIIYIIWQIFLYYTWKGSYTQHYFSFPFIQGKQNFGLPFSGLFSYIKSGFYEPVYYKKIAILIVTILNFILCISVLYNLGKFDNLYIKIIWIVYCLVLFFTTDKIWADIFNIFRTVPEFFLVSFIILASTRSKIRIFAYVISISLWLTIFIDRVTFI